MWGLTLPRVRATYSPQHGLQHGGERGEREEEKENSELYNEGYGARRYVAEGKTRMFLPQQ